MKVIFYEIQDCYYELVYNSPAIIAPPTTDKELLNKYIFIQLLDGRWVHYMKQDEIALLEKNIGCDTLIFCSDEDSHRIDAQLQADYEAQSGIGLTVLMVLLFILGVFMLAADINFGKYMSIASFLVLFISALRSNKSAGTSVIIILLSIPILFFIFVILMITSCAAFINSCGSDAEEAGRIGSLLLSF